MSLFVQSCSVLITEWNTSEWTSNHPHSNTERERSTDSSTTTYEYLFQRVCPYAFSMNFLTKAVKFNKRQVTKLNYQKTKQSTAKFLAYSIKCYVHINWSSYLQRVLLLSLSWKFSLPTHKGSIIQG